MSENGLYVISARPSRFEMVITLSTAKALGLTLPQFLRSRADRLIE
jgi:hypothetical protein